MTTLREYCSTPPCLRRFRIMAPRQHASQSSLLSLPHVCMDVRATLLRQQIAAPACLGGPHQWTFFYRDTTYGLFVVNDGHNGATAARYVADMLSDLLQPLLPTGGPPPEKQRAAFAAWRYAIQRALTLAMALLHRSFAAKGVLAGCTSTVVLQVWPRHLHHPASTGGPFKPMRSLPAG